MSSTKLFTYTIQKDLYLIRFNFTLEGSIRIYCQQLCSCISNFESFYTDVNVISFALSDEFLFSLDINN